MLSIDNNTKAFLELVRAGLWEKEARLFPYGNVDYEEVMRLAEEQSVVGLITAGLEHALDEKLPKDVVLQFVGQTLQLEQRNLELNRFIEVLVDKMSKTDIYALLVKGQGIAQCYERPLWRSSGDVDFLLCDNGFKKATDFLASLCTSSKIGGYYSKEVCLTFDPWLVEVHGTLRTGLSARVDKEVDSVQRDVFYGGNVRSWINGKTTVFLPSPDNDVFFVFSHFIKHFYKEGMNLRQVCDWCRLLWTYRNKIDTDLLDKRLNKSGLLPEWRAFATIAVDYLGMSAESMPLYCAEKKWSRKGKKLVSFILEGYTGNKIKDTFKAAKIFPWKIVCYFPSIFLNVNWLKIKERLFSDVDR